MNASAKEMSMRALIVDDEFHENTATGRAQGIIPGKTADYTILFLFSLGVTKGKWGTLINALLDFKRDYDANAPLSHVLPTFAKDHPAEYSKLGLKDLSDAMWGQMQRLNVSKLLEQAFGVLPRPVFTPLQAYEQLVLGNVEQIPLEKMVGRVLATGIVPYPPGIPLLMPGEAAGSIDQPALSYLRALQEFDRLFPGFTHDIHGVESINGSYNAVCLMPPQSSEATFKRQFSCRREKSLDNYHSVDLRQSIRRAPGAQPYRSSASRMPVNTDLVQPAFAKIWRITLGENTCLRILNYSSASWPN